MRATESVRGFKIPMTMPGQPSPQSMKYALSEVLSGMLASTTADAFSDNTEEIAATFNELATEFPLLAPMANNVDPAAIGKALDSLEAKSTLKRGPGCYTLTPEGRASCVSSKRTLFKSEDRDQLEAAARRFDLASAEGRLKPSA
jgi:hypothetical protein